jgi:hypothetical protein
VLEQNRLHRAAAERDRHGTLSDSCSWFLGWSSDLLRPVVTGCRILQTEAVSSWLLHALTAHSRCDTRTPLGSQ